jgi:outer membrane protein assembly factor BamB
VLRGVLAVVVLLATGLIGYRVFAPHETLDPARSGYPAPAQATPGLYGMLLAAPLVVDDRLRVYGKADRVWADNPLDARSAESPYWVYRRWPAQLVGVAAIGTTVVSEWSDRELVALDAVHGRIAWRAKAPAGDARYTGRRTGAATVYEPPDLYTAGRSFVVAGTSDLVAFDAGTGHRLWSRPAAPCRALFGGEDVLGCQTASTVDLMAAANGDTVGTLPAAGQSQPFACAIVRSGCRGVRTSTGAWLIGPGSRLTGVPALRSPQNWLAGDVVVQRLPDGHITGEPLSGGTGAPLWTYPASGPVEPATVIAAEPGRVHLLMSDFDLVTIDTRDGLLLSRFALLNNQDDHPFRPGHVYAVNRFVYIERLLVDGKPTDPDQAYYYPTPNVLLTGT